MQKHWYILYTKAKCEKKVSGLLTKKKIVNFFPVHWKQINEPRRVKQICEPLFSSYVFVYVDNSEMNQIKQLNNVINFVYWKGDPVIIRNTEIDEIREFVTHYHNIRLERSRVDLNSVGSVIDRAGYTVDGNVVIIKNKFIRVNLPSLGYMMIAEMDDAGVIGRQFEMRGTEKVLQS